MNAGGWVSLIALTGWLVLALSSYRAYRVGASRTLVTILAWLGIFLLVTGIVIVVNG